MSAAAQSIPRFGTWALWRLQAFAIAGMELRRNFVTRRGFWIYALALLPPGLVWLHSIVTMQRSRMMHDVAKDTAVLAMLFQIFFLRPALFFGCMGIFTWLFRGEAVERSLHYYFLAPVRREVLLGGKYIAGLITAICFFGGSLVVTFAGMYAHFPGFQIREWMLSGPGLSHFGSYLSITLLACVVWGAMFLFIGIRFRNPIIPSVVLLMWESLNVFLPSWLRRFSVLHHLQSLSPVPVEARGPGVLLGTTAEPETVVGALLWLAGITAVLLVLSVRQLRKTEVAYSTD